MIKLFCEINQVYDSFVGISKNARHSDSQQSNTFTLSGIARIAVPGTFLYSSIHPMLVQRSDELTNIINIYRSALQSKLYLVYRAYIETILLERKSPGYRGNLGGSFGKRMILVKISVCLWRDPDLWAETTY